MFRDEVLLFEEEPLAEGRQWIQPCGATPKEAAAAYLALAGPKPNVRAIAALALARAGETAKAGNLAAELDRTHPLDTLVQRYGSRPSRAAIALERKDANRAIELLKVATLIDLPQPTPANVYLCPE